MDVTVNQSYVHYDFIMFHQNAITQPSVEMTIKHPLHCDECQNTEETFVAISVSSLNRHTCSFCVINSD